MLYDLGKGEQENWIVAEEEFQTDVIQKYESIMCQGNGYMGIRNATEETYPTQLRFAVVAGTFDKYGDEVTELPNMADVTGMDISLNGETLDLTKGAHTGYLRRFNVRDGFHTRTFTWTAENGAAADFCFARFVSLSDLHLYCAKATITAKTDLTLRVKTGIWGGDRYGAPHFVEVGASAEPCLQWIEETQQSKITFVTTAEVNATVNGAEAAATAEKADHRVNRCYEIALKAGDTFVLEKRANIYTSRDRRYDTLTTEALADVARAALEGYRGKTFEALAAVSAETWATRIWPDKDVRIDSENAFDQLAVRFAIYHLTIMAPVHDNRMNIGAKGFSGPGYKGHAFWDTEIFMLPFFIFTDKAAARSLLESRYNSLPGAHRKAAENGYVGAMFPWEAAWIDDGEVTPSFARTGLLEHHITADVAQGVYYYYAMSGDTEFMDKYGYELIFDTAKYWNSRVEYNAELDRYEINCVIGPDEYTEDANNNAYTNYLAHLNMELAVRYFDELKSRNPALFAALDGKLGLTELYPQWQEKISKIYLPRENEDMIVPQDDAYLSLPSIDLTPYKEKKRWLGQDYKLEEINKLQISKQADVMVLFILLEDLFSQEVKRKNFYYYEARCIHDSSLSLSSYSILAADIHEDEQAYALYEKACRIDLGPDNNSDHGIHAASLGGIWQCSVLGFMGLRLYGNQLRIQPNLPSKWRSAETKIFWQGQQLLITVDRKTLKIKRLTGDQPVSFLLNGTTHTFTEAYSIDYSGANKPV